MTFQVERMACARGEEQGAEGGKQISEAQGMRLVRTEGAWGGKWGPEEEEGSVPRSSRAAETESGAGIWMGRYSPSF